MDPVIEPKPDLTLDTSDAVKGGSPDVDTTVSTETDALKAQLADLTQQIADRDTKLTAITTAEEKRKADELEAQGKYKELLEETNRKNVDLEAKHKASVRRVDILQAVTKCESQIPKAGLMDLAAWVDQETGGEKPIDEVLKLAEEKAKAFQAGETSAFGSTGGGVGGGTSQKAEAINNLIELGKKARATKSTNDRGMYSKARNEYMEKHGPIPSVVASKMQETA